MQSRDFKADITHEDHPSDDNTIKHHTTVASDLQDVLLLEKPKPFSRNMRRLYLILIPAYLCSTT
jgi:hypothetical protein